MWYVFQSGAQPLGFLNAHRPNQNWLTGQMHAADFLNDCPLVLLLCSKQNVRMVHADHLPVGRNDFDIQFVDGLNARNEEEEAGIIARAGELGAVTDST